MGEEQRLQDKIVKFIKDEGGFAIKIHGSALTQAGIPDIIGSLQGHPFAIEVKAQGKEPSKLQRFWLDRFGKGGYITFYCDSYRDFQERLGINFDEYRGWMA